MPEERSSKGKERRAAQREPFRRRVVFTGVRGEGLLRQGMAADISASGLLIHTAQPDIAGRHLEIELHPDGAAAPGNVIMVRGEVVWVRRHEVKGEFAMGVRFLQSFPATDVTGAGYRPATRDESVELAASIHRRLEAMEPAVRVEISEGARRAAAFPAPVTEQVGRRRSYRWLWLLLLLLGFGSVVSTVTIATLWRLGVYKNAPKPVAKEMLEAVIDAPAVNALRDSPSRIDERIETIKESGPAYYLNRGSLFLIQGRFPAALQAYQAAQANPDISPIGRFVAELGEAQALAGDGQTAKALVVLSRPWEATDEIPEPWQALRAEFLAMLGDAPDAPESRMPLVNAFALEPSVVEADAATVGADENHLRIEIDTTHHLLNVLENNSIKAVYPIGLGAQGRTPEGVFTIVNKIENPDWYNQGATIPAGSPENELGSRWIGLADESGPTPLGIHATDDLASIGADRSRGCIRMRPADVEELFTYVELGTPVSIRAL